MNYQTSDTLNELLRTFSTPRSTSPWHWVEKDEAWTGELELPGFTKNEVNVALDKDRILNIKAKQTELPEGETPDFARSERSYQLRLPKEADAEKLAAALENGILRVVLPKVTPDSQIARKIDLN